MSTPANLKEYEDQTTRILGGTIILIILGLGGVAIGLAAQAWSTSNGSLFPFVMRLDDGVQTNISYIESNQTAQLDLLARLTQEAISVLMQIQMIEPPGGSTIISEAPHLNMTVIRSGYARIFAAQCSNVSVDYIFIPGHPYDQISNYPNITYQVLRFDLNYGFVMYLLELDASTMSAPLYVDMWVPPFFCWPTIVFDTNDLLNTGQHQISSVFRFFPSPFVVNGCTPPTCFSPQTAFGTIVNGRTGSSYLTIWDYIQFGTPLPLLSSLNMTQNPNRPKVYVVIS